MELGQKLRQARLEAGLSQRQVCGEKLTRNMLSLIENGSARPSMETLRYLAGRLKKPVSWFLEEQTVTSPNQPLMDRARQAAPQDALAILEEYRAPDETFDRERWLLEALCCLRLAEDALQARKLPYAAALLERAARAGSQTPYYTEELERTRLMLCARAGTPAADVVPVLPDLTPELLLRAEDALAASDPKKALRLLDAASTPSPLLHKLRGDALFDLERWAEAAEAYKQVTVPDPAPIYRRLEQCAIALEDYKTAYFYACKQR